MSTIKQRLRHLIKCLRTDIKPSKKQLLSAAVILFGISWSLVAPVKGIEQFLFLQTNKNKLFIEETQQELPSSLEGSSDGGTYLMANTLAALIEQPDSLDGASQDISADNQESSLAILQENALLNQNNPITFVSQEPRTEIITYIVQENDTSSGIAASFGITTYTLLWANQLQETSIIRPGDELIILPVTGLLHRVKSGQTIDWIANYYKAEKEKIIAINDLTADGAIQIGQKLIIPDGQMPALAAPKTTRIASQTYVGPGTGKSRSFPYGQCTWYVAQKRTVPWSGHAKYWLANAQSYGYTTGSTPQVGAIMVLTEGGWLGRLYGHVAYVEAVEGNWVTISEMNYNCYGCKSVRTLKINDGRIRGYIY